MCRNFHKQKITPATDCCSGGDFDKKGSFFLKFVELFCFLFVLTSRKKSVNIKIQIFTLYLVAEA